jgi:hypothetical protein
MALYQAIVHARNLNDDKLIEILEKAQKEDWYSKESARIRENLLVSESQRESVDREAHVARISERQRFLFEKSYTSAAGSSSLVHAVGGCAFVEQSLSLLCPFLESRTPGSQACVLRIRADEQKRIARLEAEELNRQNEESKEWHAKKQREASKHSQQAAQEEADELMFDEEAEDDEEEEEEVEEEEEEEEEEGTPVCEPTIDSSESESD